MCWGGMLFRGNGFWYDTTGVILPYVSGIESMRKYKWYKLNVSVDKKEHLEKGVPFYQNQIC